MSDPEHGAASSAEPEWTSAQCRREDPEVFFSLDNERGPAKLARESAARAICARCVIQADCLAFALSRDDYGVWGGMTQEERRKLKRERKQAS
jgi:WhiB family redox-sensing transcriptional regulator